MLRSEDILRSPLRKPVGVLTAALTTRFNLTTESLDDPEEVPVIAPYIASDNGFIDEENTVEQDQLLMDHLGWWKGFTGHEFIPMSELEDL